MSCLYHSKKERNVSLSVSAHTPSQQEGKTEVADSSGVISFVAYLIVASDDSY